MKKEIIARLANADFYYQVGDYKTFSKNECFVLTKGDASKIAFHQQHRIWDAVDMTKEPEQSFESLCEEICRRYRERYDHICLWLSAGYDSQTILSSFMRAGVLIDEIGYHDRSDYYYDSEIPYIQQSIQIYKEFYNPNLKINRVVLDAKYYKNFYNQFADKVWFHGPGNSLKYAKSAANYVHNFHEDVIRSKTQYNRVDLFGKEKPRLDLRDGKWYMQSNDLTYFDSIGAPVECFFCTDVLPELHVKQIHMAIRFFESLPELSHELVHNIQSNDSRYYERWNLGVGRVPVQHPESRNASIKQNFANKFDSKDATNIIKYMEKREIDNFMGTRQDLFTHTGIQEKDLNQIIFGKDWYIKDRSEN